MQNESPKDQPQQAKFISKTSCPWDPRTFGGLSAPGAKDCLVGKGLNHMKSHRDLGFAMSYRPTHPEPRKRLTSSSQYHLLQALCFLTMPMASLGVKRGPHISTGILQLPCLHGELREAALPTCMPVH